MTSDSDRNLTRADRRLLSSRLEAVRNLTYLMRSELHEPSKLISYLNFMDEILREIERSLIDDGRQLAMMVLSVGLVWRLSERLNI